MKTETKIADLRATLAAQAAESQYLAARNAPLVMLDGGRYPAAHDALDRAAAAHASHVAAAARLARIPASRRGLAANTIRIARTIGDRAARRIGGDYSGTVTRAVDFGDAPGARTDISHGDKYSRSCKYSKTDAHHHVTVSLQGAIGLAENEEIVTTSDRDGLPLIDLDPMEEATTAGVRACAWLATGPGGKALKMVRGWVAYSPEFNGVCFHDSTAKGAARGLAKKIRLAAERHAAAKESRKSARRSALVARLCKGAVATVSDARAFGYCSPGIAAFQARHGLADTATLPDLLGTGDPQAVRLALHVARTVRRETANLTSEKSKH